MTLKTVYWVFLTTVIMLTIMTIFCSAGNNKSIDRSSTQIQKFNHLDNTRSAGQNKITIIKPGDPNRHIHENPETDVVIKSIQSEDEESGLHHTNNRNNKGQNVNNKKQNINEPLFFHSKIDPADLLIETGN